LNYDYLIFDCDGVILDSNCLKSQAFAEALADEPPELVKTFVEYHKEHGGISRYEKFRYYFEELKTLSNPEKEIKDAIERFATIVRKGLLECNFVPGALEFMQKAKTKKLQLFVVSGSDENELKGIFLQRNILNLFEQVYGSPGGKYENTKKVIKQMGRSKKGGFFGDSKSDYLAATKYKLDFVFVKGLSEWNVETHKINAVKVINDFNGYSR
jgi:phosphoglycolate phosphatase-like HAD superfamily hydrolase